MNRFASPLGTAPCFIFWVVTTRGFVMTSVRFCEPVTGEVTRSTPVARTYRVRSSRMSLVRASSGKPAVANLGMLAPGFVERTRLRAMVTGVVYARQRLGKGKHQPRSSLSVVCSAGWGCCPHFLGGLLPSGLSCVLLSCVSMLRSSLGLRRAPDCVACCSCIFRKARGDIFVLPLDFALHYSA